MKRTRKLMPILIIVLLLSFAAGVSAVEVDIEKQLPLTDIDGHWSEKATMSLYSYGIVDGYPDGTYAADRAVSRAEFAKLLCLFLDIAPDKSVALPFADVPQDHWAYGYVAALYNGGLINGVSINSYAPESNILRQDASKLIYEADQKTSALKLTLDTSKDIQRFSDYGQISEYALVGMTATHQGGIFNGNEQNQIEPMAFLTRGEAAQIFSNSIARLTFERLPVRICQYDWTSYKQFADLESGITMAYVEMGQPEGEPLILIHGVTDSSRSWSMAAPYLAEDYHLYIIEQRNHGDTSHPDMRDVAPELFAYDIVCFMDEMELERANVGGHSYGGYTTHTVAMLYPERVSRALLVEGSSWNAIPGEPDRSKYEEPFNQLPISGGYTDSDGTVWTDYMDWWYYNDAPVNEDFLTMAKWECSWLPLESWRAINGRTYAVNAADIPILGLWGGESGGQDSIDGMKELYPNSTQKLYEGAGHNLQWEEPARVATDIANFIESTEAATVAPPAKYPIAKKPAPPVAPTGADPAQYYDANGRLTKQLDKIEQGDWTAFKKYVELDSGIKMPYVEMGNPDGEPFLLLHGSTDTSRSWSLIAPYLAEYHLYIPDLREHGDTEKADTRTVPRYLSCYDLSCLMDELGIKKAHVAGHSRGSGIAQAFTILYPEKVNKVILLAGSAIGTDEGDGVNPYTQPPFDKLPIDREFIEEWDATVQQDLVDPLFHEYIMQETAMLDLHCWAALYFSQNGYQPQNIKSDMLIFYGTVDFLSTPARQQELKEKYVDTGIAKCIAYENRGHNLHWEETEDIANDILAFLDDTLAVDDYLSRYYEPF